MGCVPSAFRRAFFSSMNCWHSRTRRISTVPPARMKEPFPHHGSQQTSQCLCFRGRSAAGDRPKRLQSGISWAVRRRAFPFCHEAEPNTLGQYGSKAKDATYIDMSGCYPLTDVILNSMKMTVSIIVPSICPAVRTDRISMH